MRRWIGGVCGCRWAAGERVDGQRVGESDWRLVSAGHRGVDEALQTANSSLGACCGAAVAVRLGVRQ